MKIDRFVRVTLVLIAVLLVLNFVKDLGRQFHPPGSAVAAQAVNVQYLVVESPRGRAAKQAVLEKYGQQGWRLVALDFAHEESFIFTR